MNNKVLIFGGTTEGRRLAKALAGAGIPHAVSVATEYGGEIEEKDGEENLYIGRKNASEMAKIITDGNFDMVVDATHPFATDASSEIREACSIANAEYLRLSRETENSSDSEEDISFVSDIHEAASKISDLGGIVLVLTGSKELKELTNGLHKTENIFVRVLPNEESLQKCREAGLSGKQIIAMQGPFSKQMNKALISELHADVILTKESGRAGGFIEKIEAAKECGIKTVVIRNPEKASGKNDGKTMAEIIKEIERFSGISIDIHGIYEKTEDKIEKRKITLAGMGPGDKSLFTCEFEKAYNSADIIFGAASINDAFKELTGIKTPIINMYKGEEILDYLKEHSGYKRPLVIYSGDISLCSGAQKASRIFKEDGFIVNKIPGISSVTLFAERLQINLENCEVISAHGKEVNVIGHALCSEKLMVLTSGYEHAIGVASQVPGYMKVVLGYELGSGKEKIIDISKNNIDKDINGNGYATLESGSELKGRCILYIENPLLSGRTVYPCLHDDVFIRGNVPMTKEEIRSFSIRKLGLTCSSVLYDIGAGTGSVSIEAALIHPDIRVYSIEKKKEAIELLYRNREKFCVENMEVIEGTAPEALDGLKVPTHVFIGGSSGNMREIIEKVRELNDKARIVINCLTPQTLSEVMNIVAGLHYREPEITQISATRFKKVGSYDLPDAQNPVYIVSF